MLTKQEIRQLGNKEMIEELQKSRRELLKAQFEIRTQTSKASHLVKNLKHYIARLQTIAKELKIEITPAMSKAEPNMAEEKTASASAKKSTKAPKKESTEAPKATKSVKKTAKPKKTKTSTEK